MLLKVIISVAIILIATTVGKKLPATAGLIGVMPLASALVLVWMHVENKGNSDVMQEFTKGALWGILPSVLFYIVAYVCFKKQLPPRCPVSPRKLWNIILTTQVDKEEAV